MHHRVSPRFRGDENDGRCLLAAQPVRPRDSFVGNCDLCFLKGKRNLIRTIRPERTKWWIDQEEHILRSHGRRLRNSKMAQFSQRYRYSELLEEALVADPQLVLIDTDGDDGVSCFCGD